MSVPRLLRAGAIAVALGGAGYVAPVAHAQTVWQGGSSGNWNVNGNWSAGIPNSGSNAFIDSNGSINTTVFVNTFGQVNNLTIDAGDTLHINNAQRLSVFGGVFNDGLLQIGTVGSATYFQPIGTTTLSGSGVLELMGAQAWVYDNQNLNAASDHLINSAGHTIRGVGNIGFGNTLQITNQGVIDANVLGGTLNVTPNGLGMVNTGVMRASNGGNLNLNGFNLGAAVIDNTGGIIEALAGSTVTHNTSNNGVLGGQLTGAGTHVIGSNWARFDTLTVDAYVDLANSNRLDLLGTITNNNLIQVNSTGSATYLQTVGTTTLAGNGVVELTGAQAWMYDNSNSNLSSDHLINTSSHTIRGAGNIGFGNSLQITNQGLIDANVSGGSLNVTPNSAGLINTGVMRASNGGNLNLNGASMGSGVFDNTLGIIEAQAGSTVTHNTSAGRILGGQVTGAGTHTIGSSWARFDSLTVGAFVNVVNSNRLDLLGTITNNNLIRVNSTGAATYLQTVGTNTLAGNGVVELTGPQAWMFDNSNSNLSSDHLINTASHTIRGAGNIGFGNSLQITNLGLIDANVSGGTLNVTPNGSGLVNSGLMRASNGGNLNLVGTSLGSAFFDNSFGVIEAQAGSTVTHNTTNNGIIGGQLTGAGTHVIGSSGARFDSLTVDAYVDIVNSRRLDIVGFITNYDLIRVNSSGSATYLQTVGTTTLAGTGVVELMGPQAWMYDNSNSNASSDHLINSLNHTIRGAGNIGFTNSLQITNQGLIEANVSGGTLNVISNAAGSNNFGTLRASNGGTLNLSGNNHGGTGVFEALDASQLLVDTATTAANVSAGGVLTDGTWRAIDAGLGATLRIRNNATALINTIGSNAAVELSGANSLFTVRTANTTLDSTLNQVQGSLSLRNGRTMTTSAGLSNSGAILVDGAATSLTVSDNYLQTGGSFTLNDGTLNLLGTSNQASGGLIAGNGTINGDLVFDGSAMIDPGFSPGQLNFGNDLTWGAGGGILFDLGLDSLSSDFISVAGDLLKGGTGTYAFTFVDNGWVSGQTYDLISFSSTDFDLSDFSFTNTGNFGGSFAFSGGNLLQFTVSAIPEPSMAGIFLVTAGMYWMGRRRRV